MSANEIIFLTVRMPVFGLLRILPHSVLKKSNNNETSFWCFVCKSTRNEK